MATAVDPICNMDVDTENPPGGKSEHKGTTYFFCGPGCRIAFEKDPEKYLAADWEGINMESSSSEQDTVEHDHHGHDHGEHNHGKAHQEPAKRGSFLSWLFGKSS